MLQYLAVLQYLERKGFRSVTVARDGAARIYVELMNDRLLGMDRASVLVVDGESHAATVPSIVLGAVPVFDQWSVETEFLKMVWYG